MEGVVACNTPETTINNDLHYDGDNDGTADACTAAGQGSQCDTYHNKCTLPYAERTVKPVIWHYTNASDMEYFDPSAKATNDWDTAMRLAVRAAQYTECARPKGTDGIDAECAAQFPLHFGQ
jgi:hypothetical protein